MGAAASLKSELDAATPEQLAAAVAALPPGDRDKLKSAFADVPEQTGSGVDWEQMFAHKGEYNEADFGPPPDYSKPEGWYCSEMTALMDQNLFQMVSPRDLLTGHPSYHVA